MRQTDDLSKSLTPFVQSNTLVAVIELSLSSWLVAGVVPGITRQPLKKLGADESGTSTAPSTLAGRGREEWVCD
jgi:transposase